MMEEEKTLGIILKAVPYQDHHHIVSAFTESGGMIRLFIRGTKRARRASHAICTPLVLAELLFRPKGSGLFSFREGHVLDPFSGLRRDYQRLEVAGQMAKHLLATLWQEKPAPGLFQLVVRFLKATETHSHPKTLLTSFLCKLLKHEGLWKAPIQCNRCGIELQETVLVGGEAFCPNCISEGGIFLNGEERKQMVALTEARKFDEMGGEVEGLQEKVEALFKTLV